MNYKIAAATLVIACAFGTAGCSHNAADQEGTPSAASTQPSYTSTAAATPGVAATAGMAVPASSAGGMATAGSAAGPSASFDDLAGSKGYISQEDAGHDAWLSEHFSGCDSNNDGKLTRDEYAQCMQQNGTATEGMPSSAASTH